MARKPRLIWFHAAPVNASSTRINYQTRAKLSRKNCQKMLFRVALCGCCTVSDPQTRCRKGRQVVGPEPRGARDLWCVPGSEEDLFDCFFV